MLKKKQNMLLLCCSESDWTFWKEEEGEDKDKWEIGEDPSALNPDVMSLIRAAQ